MGRALGGGAIAWKCEAPAAGDDSSGAAELRMVVRAVKYNIGIRALLRDFDIGIAPTQPTNIYTDAEAVVSGRGGERMAKSSRWMAVRYAMLRWAETCLTARLGKTTSVGNCADIMTKCVIDLVSCFLVRPHYFSSTVLRYWGCVGSRWI